MKQEWSPGAIARRHVFVSGKVQGVFFRQETRRMANREGVGGWVRNLPDGRVEAVFEGPVEAVERAVRWCGHGPGSASVSGVTASEEPPAGERRFRVR